MTQFQISADVALHLGNLLLHKDTIGLKGKGGKTANLHETYHAHMLLGNTASAHPSKSQSWVPVLLSSL